MVTTADAELARTLRLLRNQGMEQRYANEIVGANMRMTDVAAAIGRVQLAPAARLDRAAPGATPSSSTRRITALVTAAGRRRRAARLPPVHGAGTRRPRRRAAALWPSSGIGNAVYYPTPIHRLKPYLSRGRRPDPAWDLPETERAAARGAVAAGPPVADRRASSDAHRGRRQQRWRRPS